jgi:hypothetical protein
MIETELWQTQGQQGTDWELRERRRKRLERDRDEERDMTILAGN